MEGYKVIKDFSFAEKGDVFTKVKDLDLWELQKSDVQPETETHTSMVFDSTTMDKLAEKDYVIWYSEDECEDCDCECCCDKLEDVKEYINTLIDTYTKDYSELMEDYDKGNVQPCVKVEAETVYHNLNKVLNSIKNKLDE